MTEPTTDEKHERPRLIDVSQINFQASFAAGALSYGEQVNVRSIGGRLGGHFDSARSLDLLPILAAEDEEEGPPGEASPLIRRLSSRDVHIPHASPPLAIWIVPALLCASAYALYNIFIKKGSYSINPILGGVILQLVAAVMGTVLIGVLKLTSDIKLHYDTKGIKQSICAGLAVGVAEMLSFCVSGMGVPVTRSIPIIIGGSVMFGAVLGLVVLGEKMMLHGWSGIILLVTGIGMVATDPGEKAEEGNSVGATFQGSPPLVVWIFPALTCASAYALYNIFIKMGSASINPILGGVILQYVAALFGTCLLGGLVLVDLAMELNYDRMGVIWAVCAGFAVGAAEMLSFCVSGMGVQATQSIPVIIGGSVMFGAVLGLAMLSETMMIQGWCGVFLLMSGIALVATDPGEKVAGH